MPMMDDFDDPIAESEGRAKLAILIGATAALVLVVGGLGWYFLAGRAAFSGSTDGITTSGIDMSSPAAGVPRENGRQVIGDWIYACDTAHCFIRQNLHYPGATPVDAAWRIEADGKGGLMSVWTTPTNLIVRRGLQLDVGSGKSIVVPFESCSERSCEIRANLAPDFIAILRQASRLAAGVTFRNDRNFAFEFSPKSFTLALDRLVANPLPAKSAGG